MSKKEMSSLNQGIIAGIAMFFIICFGSYLYYGGFDLTTDAVIKKMLTLKFILPRILIAIIYAFLLIHLIKNNNL